MVRSRSIPGAMLILCGALAASACVTEPPAGEATASGQQSAAAVLTVTAVLRDANANVIATVVFTAIGNATLVSVIARLPDGHFNPGAATHGNHAGDMPPLFVAASGNTATSFITDRFTPAAIKGRAVILHAGADNFGNIPLGTAANQYTANAADATTLTANTGNAGNRIACGVIQ